MKVVTMYTPYTPYEKQVKVLIKSLNKFNIDYKVFPIANCGNWTLNCKMNAHIILNALKEFRDDVLYLDADAELLQDIPLLKNMSGYDIACHVIDYGTRLQLCSGTTWVNKKSVGLIEKWIELNESNDEIDDDNLHKVIIDNGFKLNELPENYCSIYRNRIQTGLNPVIKHWQRSRQFRSVIDGK